MALSTQERPAATGNDSGVSPSGTAAIRHYEPVDYPSLLELWQSSGLKPFTEQSIGRLIASGGQVLVAERQERDGRTEIVGTLSWSHNGEMAFLWRVAVATQARGRGIAKALLHCAEVEIRDAGFAGVGLLTREENVAARSLYKGQGWKYQVGKEFWGKRLIPQDEDSA